MEKEIRNIIEATSMGKLEKESVLNELLNLHSVSNRDSKLPDLVLHVGKDGVIQVFDQDNNAVLYEGTEIECKDFISGFNGC